MVPLGGHIMPGVQRGNSEAIPAYAPCIVIKILWYPKDNTVIEYFGHNLVDSPVLIDIP